MPIANRFNSRAKSDWTNSQAAAEAQTFNSESKTLLKIEIYSNSGRELQSVSSVLTAWKAKTLPFVDPRNQKWKSLHNNYILYSTQNQVRNIYEKRCIIQ